METKAEILVTDQIAMTPLLDYSTKLALLFVDICDFIGLPVNLPTGLQTKEYLVTDNF